MALTDQAPDKTLTKAPSDNQSKRQMQRLQCAIVDGLEDFKARDIAVFNTESLSSLFERVVIATGTSNRQTRALAQSVQGAVREAGFEKPRTEGEENGEWVIVDCGAAVVHIMQESIRSYYQLEALWGDKPVHVCLDNQPRQAISFASPKAAATKGRTQELQESP